MTAGCGVSATRPPLLAGDPPADLSTTINQPQAVDDSPVGVRFPADEKALLLRAAAAEERPVAQLVRKIVRDYLRRAGFLSERSA